jgi:signal transduction histidine kinase
MGDEATLERIRKLLHRFAIVVGLLVAFGFPLVSAWIDYGQQRSNLIFRVNVIASQVGVYAKIHGRTWPYSSHRLPEIAAIGDPENVNNIKVHYIFRGRRLEAKSIGDMPPWPHQVVERPVISHDQVVGFITLTSSYQTIIKDALGSFLFSGGLGTLVYLIFYRLPLRIMTGAIDALTRSRESLRQEVELKNQALERMEHEAERAREASEVKSRFLAHMSHEMRTPLNAIIGFSDMLKSELLGELPGAYKGYAKDINPSGVHLLSVVNALLDLSKIEHNKAEVYPTDFDIRGLMDEAVRLLMEMAREKEVRLDLQVRDSVPSLIHTDRSKLYQAVLNTVSNAVKYTPSSGTVTIEVNSDLGLLEIMVEDNGVGMTDEEIIRAMEPFGQVNNPFTASGGGTGLGLPICKEFITLLNGRFDMMSEPGKGTTVLITIPEVLEETPAMLSSKVA